jgi:hypothetical protein
LAAIDLDRDPRPGAEALDLRPLADRTGDVVLAAGVVVLLEERLVPGRPELLAGIGGGLAVRIPAGVLVFGHAGQARERAREWAAVGLGAPDHDQVALAALGELALDRRHPQAPGRAVGTDRVEQHAGVPHAGGLGPLPTPAILDRKVVVAVGPLRGHVAHVFIAAPQHAVFEAEHALRIVVAGLLEPLREPVEPRLGERPLHAFRRTGLFGTGCEA